MLYLTEAGRLLDPTPLPLETGYERLPDGVLHVACRTDMSGCTGEMFEWWFRSRPDTQQYIWWHPVDHVSSDWAEGEGSPDTHVGSVHLVDEYLTGLPNTRLAIQFRETTEFFDAAAWQAARDTGQVSAAVCGRIGLGHDAPRDESGAVLGGRLLHIGRDTSWGMVLRSHFYLGHDLPALGMSPAEIEQMSTERFGQALLQHAYNEFTFLARFLPSLYLGDNRADLEIDLPW